MPSTTNVEGKPEKRDVNMRVLLFPPRGGGAGLRGFFAPSCFIASMHGDVYVSYYTQTCYTDIHACSVTPSSIIESLDQRACLHARFVVIDAYIGLCLLQKGPPKRSLRSHEPGLTEPRCFWRAVDPIFFLFEQTARSRCPCRSAGHPRGPGKVRSWVAVQAP